jgi:hypothetical protein
MQRYVDDMFIYRVKKTIYIDIGIKDNWVFAKKVDNWVMDICIIGTILLD